MSAYIAIAMPEGEGFAGQYGRTGFMLFFSVLVRAPLMVGGFMAASVLMIFIGNIVGYCFLIFISGMTASNAFGLTTFLICIFLITMILIIASHKVYGLITHLPRNVIGWIGQQGQNLGEEADEQRTRQFVGGAVMGRGEGIAGRGVGAGAGSGKGGGGGKPPQGSHPSRPLSSNPSDFVQGTSR